jgi:hypothetical protein
MSEENESSDIAWEIARFIAVLLPSGLGIAFTMKDVTEPWFIVLNLVCSLVASIGFTRGLKGQGRRVIARLALTFGFFVLNLTIMFFAACGSMGRITP